MAITPIGCSVLSPCRSSIRSVLLSSLISFASAILNFLYRTNSRLEAAPLGRVMSGICFLIITQNRWEKGQREELKNESWQVKNIENGVFKCSCDTGTVRQSDFNAAGSLTSVWCVGAFKLNAAHLFSNIIPSYIYTLSPVVLEHMGLNFLQTGVHSGDNIIITFKMATTSSFLILGKKCCLW